MGELDKGLDQDLLELFSAASRWHGALCCSERGLGLRFKALLDKIEEDIAELIGSFLVTFLRLLQRLQVLVDQR